MVGQFDSLPITDSTSGGYVCMDCGQFVVDGGTHKCPMRRVTCPHCGKEIEINLTSPASDYGNDDGYKERMRNPNTTEGGSNGRTYQSVRELEV